MTRRQYRNLYQLIERLLGQKQIDTPKTTKIEPSPSKEALRKRLGIKP